MLKYKLYKEEYLDEMKLIFDEIYQHKYEIEDWLEYYTLNRDKIYCLFRDNEIIGYGAYQLFNEASWLSMITIKESEQRKGYGKKIVKYLINKLKKKNVSFISLETDKKDFYTPFGFELYKDWGEEYEEKRYAMDLFLK